MENTENIPEENHLSASSDIINDLEELQSSDLISDGNSYSTDVNLQNNSLMSENSEQTSSNRQISEQELNHFSSIPTNNFFQPLLHSFQRSEHHSNYVEPITNAGNSFHQATYPRRCLLYGTNRYVTVSGHYEEPLDESVTPLPNLRSEQYRLRTFEGNWPSNMTVQINPFSLARNGFYYIGPHDRVRCAFCSGVLKKWAFDDDVETEHKKHFPQCPFIMGYDVGNVPVGLNEISKSNNFMHKPDVFGIIPVSKMNSESVNETPNEHTEKLGIVQNKPKYPRYTLETDRLATFKNWPSQIRQQPKDLAKAGLFYIGDGDNVKCFTCGGILSQWEPDDDPWVEHAKWFPDCQFVRLVKGDKYIQEILLGKISDEEKYVTSISGKQQEQDSAAVQALLQDGYKMQDVSEAIKYLHKNGDVPDDVIPSAEKILKVILDNEMVNGPEECLNSRNEREVNMKNSDSKEKDITALIKENLELKEQKKCKICLDNEISIIFLPCGHLVCCAECASSLSECPICRGAIKGAAKAFWA